MYETLYYAAMLRLPRDMPEPEKVARVDAVIAALGIDSCRNTIIGAPLSSLLCAMSLGMRSVPAQACNGLTASENVP